MTQAAQADRDSMCPLIVLLQPIAIVESWNRLFQRSDEINRGLLASLRETNNAGWTLAACLVKCGDPVEAGRLFNDWCAARRDAILEDGKRLSGIWLKLLESEPASAPTRGADQPTTARTAGAE